MRPFSRSALDAASQLAGRRLPAPPAEEAKALDLSTTQSTAVPDGSSVAPDLSMTQSTVLPSALDLTLEAEEKEEEPERAEPSRTAWLTKPGHILPTASDSRAS